MCIAFVEVASMQIKGVESSCHMTRQPYIHPVRMEKLYFVPIKLEGVSSWFKLEENCISAVPLYALNI